MTYSPELAEIRFGCGLSSALAPPASPDVMLAGLRAADSMAKRFPVGTTTQLLARLAEINKLRRRARKTSGNASSKTDLVKQVKGLKRQSAQDGSLWYVRSLLRWSYSENALQERLAAF